MPKDLAQTSDLFLVFLLTQFPGAPISVVLSSIPFSFPDPGVRPVFPI